MPFDSSRLRRDSKEGSALVTVLCMVVVLAAVAGSILSLVSQEYMLSKRSLAWNQAIFAAESGVEIGWNEINRLTAINTNGTFMSGWTSAGANTWTLNNQSLVPLAGTEGNSLFSVTVVTNSPQAGYVTITANGAQGTTLGLSNATRTLVVTLKPNTPFTMAILAKGLIDFNGNAAVVDSWNSASGDYSAALKRAHGDIGTNGQLIDAAGLDVYGNMKTGPGGTVTTASGFNQYQPSGTDTGTNTVSDGLKVSIPDAKLPTGFLATTDLGAVNNVTTVTGTGGTLDVSATSIDLNGKGKNLTITGSGTVRLYVSGNTSLGGQSSITITPSPAGSSLKVEFYSGGTVNLDGNGIMNPDSNAADFLLYGLPTCTSVSINGTADFTGAIYAPNATATLTGGARVDGSLVANAINAVGTIDFHYDEALGNAGNVISYSVANWREM